MQQTFGQLLLRRLMGDELQKQVMAFVECLRD